MFARVHILYVSGNFETPQTREVSYMENPKFEHAARNSKSASITGPAGPFGRRQHLQSPIVMCHQRNQEASAQSKEALGEQPTAHLLGVSSLRRHVQCCNAGEVAFGACTCWEMPLTPPHVNSKHCSTVQAAFVGRGSPMMPNNIAFTPCFFLFPYHSYPMC